MIHPALPCPCQSSNSYKSCCQPYHLGQVAATAEILMRSRYSAFALQQIDYIVSTTLPAQQRFLSAAELTDWANNTDWCGLEIVQTRDSDKTHAQVEFKAYFNQSGHRHVHHELSTFVYAKDPKLPQNAQHSKRWYFLHPMTEHLPTQKQPCFCGNNKKFKHCCGMFLL